MDIRISIARTFQAQEFEPIKIEVEASVKNVDVDDYEEFYDDLYEKIEESLVKSESKLRDIYCPSPEKKRKRKTA